MIFEHKYKDVIGLISREHRNERPYFFILDYHKERGYFLDSEQLDNEILKFDFSGTAIKGVSVSSLALSFTPLEYSVFENAFNKVYNHILSGDSYLLNLCFKSKIHLNLSLNQIFEMARAKYKVFLHNQFVAFSPETFVIIEEDKIHTYPMKGTRIAESEADKELLLNDPKENAEHYTIVDLLRNDLSIVANEVRVEQFKYLDLIQTDRHSLWQMSSHISGKVREHFKENIGELLDQLLPAGSVTGAPKKRTCEIITEAENFNRKYYTGICGYFDGLKLETAVLIRFIELENSEFYFKSGGGITSMSDSMSEYLEVLNKIYVPVF